MASQKRKRNSTRRESNKRPKYTTSSDNEHTQNASGEWWEAECILDERIRRGKRQYLIKWKGIDPTTGQEYPPNWEPEQCANELLLESWEQEKADKGVAISAGNSGNSSKGKGRSRRQQQALHTPRRNRKSRVVRSSPEASTTRSTSPPTVPSTPARDSTALTADYSTVRTPIGASEFPQRASPRIQIAPRRNSFNPEEFDRFSQIPASQRESTQSRTQETDLDSSQLVDAAGPFSSGIVPDSQSSAGEATFIPITQQTGYSSQQSTNRSESQEEEEDVTEDSGILEIIQKATSRVASPARSIPETIPEAGPDTESQHPGADLEDPRFISDTLEIIEEPSQAVKAVADDEGRNTSQEHWQQIAADWESEQQRVEAPSREENALPNYIEGASQPALDGFLRVVVPSGSQQEQQGSITEAHAAFVKSAAVADRAVEETQVVTGNSPTFIDSGPSQSRQAGEDQTTRISPKEPTNGKARETSQRQSSQHIGPCDSQTTSAEQIGNEENAQSLLHFHYLSQHLQSARSQTCAQDDSPSTQCTTDVDFYCNVVPQTQPEQDLLQASAESVTIPESSDSAPQQPEPELSSHSFEHGNDLITKSLGPGDTHNPLPVGENQPPIDNQESKSAADSILIPQIVTEEIVRRRDFALCSQPTSRSSAQSAESREQNAQVLPVEPDFSTQEDTTQSIRPTIENECGSNRANSESRHDSSQETPERRLRSVEHSSSPIPRPPTHSLDTLDSKLPSRPTTPIHTTSPSNMASHDTGEEVAQQLKERLAKRQAENPYTPTRRIIKSSLTPSATAPTPDTPTAVPTSARRFLEANAAPSATAADGTRSPSTVPDRSPAPQAPTSLRTVAFAPNGTVPAAESDERELTSKAGVPPERANIEPTLTAGEPASPSQMPTTAEPEDEELSDIDDDSESLLNDDLNLEREEYIVPLYIEGRQCDMYSEHIKHKKELLEQFLNDPSGFDQLAIVEEVLSHLKALETHIDLVFAEAEPASWLEMSSETQIEFAAQFGMENSVKFRFLHTLFHHLREKDKHIVLVTANDNGALFNILETFCKAKFVNYSIPTRGRQAIPMNIEGALTITILPGDSDASPVIRAPDLIICLDGFQEASQIRQKNWARSSHQDIVPVLHLVIPRSVGHIERYISPALNHRERLHTTLASLAQMIGDLGKPIDEDTPRAPVAAEMVVDWLTAANDDEGLSWPLPSIGSVKNITEYQSQLSQASQVSLTSPVPERTKRPLDDEDLDPAKRMRFTPQPQAVPSSSVNHEHDITHISDSMPGTAADNSSLRRQLARVEEAYQKERAARKAEEQRFRDHEEMWDKQQTVHENLTREYRLLLGQQKSTEESLETMTKNNETLRDRLSSRTTEMRQLNEQLEEQRATHLLSDDERIAEITRLRKELATAQEDKQRALKTTQTTESTLEYTKEQYRLAQDAATSSQSIIEELNASNAKLQHQASGQPAKLKALHLDRQAENQEKLIKSLRAENTILKRTLGQKEDELQRVRNNPGRAGVGTRAQSVTPQPKVRSRAGSPMGGRLSNLRNG